jgi:hypothetical protein
LKVLIFFADPPGLSSVLSEEKKFKMIISLFLNKCIACHRHKSEKEHFKNYQLQSTDLCGNCLTINSTKKLKEDFFVNSEGLEEKSI